MREILDKGSISLAAKLLGSSLNFLFQVLLARMLGVEGVGIYYLALAATTFASLVVRMGMDFNLTRVVAAKAEDEDWTAVRAALRHALQAGVAAAVVGFGSIYLGADWIVVSVFSKSELALPLNVMAFSIAPAALVILFARALQGLRKVGEAMLVETAVAPFIACIVVFPLVNQYDVVGGAVAYCIGVISALLVAVWVWRSQSKQWGARSVGSDEGSVFEFVTASSPLFGVNLCQQLALVAPLFILGAMKSSSEAGLFYTANRTAALIGLLLVASNSIIAPKVAALYHNGEIGTLDRVVRRSAMLVTLVAAPAVLVFTLAPSLVMMIFGDEFVAAADLLRVLAVGQLINVISGSVSFVLMMTENYRSMFVTALWTVIVNLLISFVLIPDLGAMGAALATAGSLLVASALRVLFVWRSMGIVALPIPKRFISSRAERD
jgi:O-antigen/teichoic acid export membrane protein